MCYTSDMYYYFYGYFNTSSEYKFLCDYSDCPISIIDPMFMYFVIVMTSELDAMNFKLSYVGEIIQYDTLTQAEYIKMKT